MHQVASYILKTTGFLFIGAWSDKTNNSGREGSFLVVGFPKHLEFLLPLVSV